MTDNTVSTTSDPRPLRYGAAFWVAFSLAAVLVRGVQWDENYEFAQVILGLIPYPDGHPIVQYVRGFFSLQTYLTAAFIYAFPEPLPVNLLRNWAFLASSTVPVFLLGTLLSRRALIGHIAVVFILLEIHVPFYSSYPIHVWPGVFSNGPVGMGYMLLGLWALVARHFRTAGLLLGFAPAVHLGQFPPLLAVTLIYAGMLLATGQRRALWAIAVHAVPGLAVCTAFAVFLHYFAVDPPVAGPYFTPVAPELLWRTYMERYATHRAIPYTTGHFVLVAALLAGIGLAIARGRWNRAPGAGSSVETTLASPRGWAALYCAIASLIVWGIMLVHYATGPGVPFLLAGWLPYRLMNHVSPVLIPLLLAMACDRDGRVPWYLALLLLAALLAPLLHLAEHLHHFVERYITPNDYLYFLLAGAAAGTGLVLAVRKGLRYGAATGLGLLLLLGALAWFHQFGAACAAAGVALALIPGLPARRERLVRITCASLAALLLAAMLGRGIERRADLPRSPFHIAVAERLAAKGEPGAMILVPHMQVGDQMKFGHPVMADMATLLFAGYRPAIAPAASALYQDFYDISLDPDAKLPDPPRPWYEVWPAKSLDEWRALGEKYNLRYVAAPDFMRLPLLRILSRSGRILYRIPEPEETLAPDVTLSR